VDVSLLRLQLFAILEPYRPGEARVRAVMTRKGQVYLAAEPLQPLPPETYKEGVRVETTDLHRRQPRLKSTTFIDRSERERKHLAQEGFFEALLVKDRRILEGMTSNFFYIPRAEGSAAETKRAATLCTARDNILLGITRETVLEVAQGLGLEISYQPLRLDQLTMLQEAFITSSTRGVLPVIQIDQTTIGEGRPGTITQQLSTAYNSYVIENAETIL
jgi:branched-chain amino acid aminotransferase